MRMNLTNFKSAFEVCTAKTEMLYRVDFLISSKSCAESVCNDLKAFSNRQIYQF